ncbi:16S rRNA (cytosine(967)-C(5))-methyltransferase RsmB [Proteiniborus sp. MB09-C3]|uniref:16S rRNA (cytosine(967)-C(5))-methyltransferase RsmB n=1 Tax=Proteiniborus sp. MB09-C3 TaxID=3050072 RepID=UPI00255767FB|nr:16S rRNA (cytosine(967)-C(5))-methyltransferase RsmB [Proteiniborus sp. MB09-C3]WIV10803.1 16S rRNA (cytosine(967)-C(5))-methyltransferase RsmB [Proteiniborus sp. MB09-C3]
MNKNPREIAVKILGEINEEKAYSNISITRNINEGISNLDESLIREMVYGVIENKLLIDWVIMQFSKVKIKKIAPIIKEILRIGVYQILFMDKIPDSAAVNESVKLAKKYGHKGSVGYVNAILRNISRNKSNLEFPKRNNDPVEYLSVKYSHPKWMVEKWLSDYGLSFTEELCIANNEKPKLNIRVNTLKISKLDLMEKLESKGFIVSEGKYAYDCIIIDNPVRITDTEEFKSGLFQIQDESSMMVAQIMDPSPGSLVIDVCSAPGGKTTHIAQKMQNEGKIIARDIHEHKLQLIEGNIKRLGINIIELEKFNALDLDEKLIGKADYCLVDAPCSGLGLIRRKPDIKWNKEKDNLIEIAELQYEILMNSSMYVKNGGLLVYSTCTIQRDENIHLIRKFTENNNFKLISFESLINNTELKKSATNGYIELYPNINNTDGFFIAKMIKI